MAEKGGYKHFMLKEIFEQPRAIKDTMLGRVGQETRPHLSRRDGYFTEGFRSFSRSRSSPAEPAGMPALTGKFMIERLARLPVEVDYGSEFRYRDPIIQPNTLTVVISQSGETADTLAAQREAKQKGSKTLAICNVVGSMITREATGTLIRMRVRRSASLPPKLSPAVHRTCHPRHVPGAGSRHARRESSRNLVQELLTFPASWNTILSDDPHLRGHGRERCSARTDFLYLGRGIHFPIALEGALKLKEISYIHAEGYPAGEMKHGPNALIDEKLPVVVLATHDPESQESQVLYEKTLSNIQEVKAREGNRGGDRLRRRRGSRQDGRPRDHDPATRELLLPILEIDSAAIARLSHRCAAGLRCRSAAQSGKERHSGMTG